MTTLSDLYDADKRAAQPGVARLAGDVTIPHPLHGPGYADGLLLDTTAGMVRTPSHYRDAMREARCG